MEQNQLNIILKALPDQSLSSGHLKLYAFSNQATLDTSPIGCAELYNYDPLNRRAAVGLIVSNEHRHQGYGTAIILALIDFCLNNTHLHQIYADIAAINHHSIRIFQKNGFHHCATMKDWVAHNNGFIDTLRFQRILMQ